MGVKIEQRIVGYGLKAAEADEAAATGSNVVHMHEKVERPESLQGATYKIKTPLSEHALYVTINDIVLNPGTEHEARRPFEIFINSKNMDHFQWIVALTRIISAVFRKGGDVTFLTEELKAVFDPRGGYFQPGGKFMPSLVAEIGDAVERHLRSIGMIKDEPLDPARREALEAVRAKYVAASGDQSQGPGGFPASAALCKHCTTKAVVQVEGCETCLNCGHSHCG